GLAEAAGGSRRGGAAAGAARPCAVAFGARAARAGRGPTRLEPGHRASHAGARAGDARPALLEGPGSGGRTAPARRGTADLRSARLRGGGRPRPGKGSGRAPRRRPALRGATAPGAAVVTRLYARPRRRRRARAGGPGEPARLARPVAGSTRRAGGGGGARPGAGRSEVVRALGSGAGGGTPGDR